MIFKKNNFILFSILTLILFPFATKAENQVGIYEVFEAEIINTNSYSNPFNFNEIELQVVFTSPTNENHNFFGFYDGDGNGGQSGNVWKIRFMPDAIGTWKTHLSSSQRTLI